MRHVASRLMTLAWLAVAPAVAVAQMDPHLGFHDEDDRRSGVNIAHRPEDQPGWRDFVGRTSMVWIESESHLLAILPKSAEALRACTERCESAACIERCRE